MQLYEISYLITPDSKKEEISSLKDKLISFIKEEEGEIVKSGSESKKKLAYSIKKQKEAYLDEITFNLEKGNFEKLEKKIKTEKSIIRFLIIKKKVSTRKTEPRVRRKIASKPKVELKAIEEKLDEILKEQ